MARKDGVVMSEDLAADTHARALAINLEPTSYGSFAEIGGGQEVARWFLTAGAASGTVAQTISAYDKAFSDKTYGAGTRYVSRERLLSMLDREYSLLVERLGPIRGDKSRFFAFANTVATRSFKGDNEQHGWIGLRFQAEIGAEPSDVLIHVNWMDPAAQLQQEALGVLGVNLLYSVYNARGSAEAFLECLWGGLSLERIEIDVLHIHGPAFAGQNEQNWCLQLLRLGMTNAVLFDVSFEAVEPSSILRKRPLIVDRGRFEKVEPFHAKMLQSATQALKQEGVALEREPQGLLEMTLHPVMDDDAVGDAEILRRIGEMLKVAPALVTNLAEAYRLIPYLRRHTTEPIRLVAGVTHLARILQTQFYDALAGSQLEGMGKLFASNVKLYVYPMARDAILSAVENPSNIHNVRLPDASITTVGADDLLLASPLIHLYRYLREAGRILPVAAEGA